MRAIPQRGSGGSRSYEAAALAMLGLAGLLLMAGASVRPRRSSR